MPLDVRGAVPLLLVLDVSQSLRFYRDALGFEVLDTAGYGDWIDWALIRMNGVELMLNAAYEEAGRPDAPDPARHAAHSDVTVYFGCPDVEGAYEHLRAAGLDVDPPSVTSYGFRAVGLRDPDGYGLCFHWPVDSRWDEKWRAWYGIDPVNP